MTTSNAYALRRPRPVVALVAALGLLAAVLGCWLLRFDRAASDTPSPAPTSVAAAHHTSIDRGSSPTYHGAVMDDDHPIAPSQTSVKSAGLHRDRPPTSLRVVPSLQESPSAVPVASPGRGFSVGYIRAPGAVLAGQERLTQFCIARR
ncbi:hypothetical protein [Mycobacterium branderi]|uniref:Lipoprotein LpqS n=1 Tax=Mycobacterium branderi TaxID=43348 RepID=A0A7I7WA19_9MYCO|nr:hypothetical protein [Mycobacterium branderi]MCV7232463.1 hypothetical protein [Mycobacterium branderi]ORA40638.1 hypothetical protein BST20_00210 [Mycobacterium branderi]BBZ14489.1 hypothetical protein MBRA_46840 [Mycobacterium branderi]